MRSYRWQRVTRLVIGIISIYNFPHWVHHQICRKWLLRSLAAFWSHDGKTQIWDCDSDSQHKSPRYVALSLSLPQRKNSNQFWEFEFFSNQSTGMAWISYIGFNLDNVYNGQKDTFSVFSSAIDISYSLLKVRRGWELLDLVWQLNADQVAGSVGLTGGLLILLRSCSWYQPTVFSSATSTWNWWETKIVPPPLVWSLVWSGVPSLQSSKNPSWLIHNFLYSHQDR